MEEETQAHIEEFATFGLRTLLVAWRPVTRAELRYATLAYCSLLR